MGEQKLRSDIKILSLGAAVQDVFLQGKLFTPKKEGKEYVEEFELGSKNDIEGVIFSTGGGATNASVTFARQGLHAMFMGKIGNDIAGKAVLDDLHNEDIDTSLVQYLKDIGTGYSCLLLAPNGERTVLTYRGASAHLDINIEDFNDVEADWMLVTSMAGNFEALETVFSYAESKNINIAMIPGKDELREPEKYIKFVPRLKILTANKEELQMLYKGETLEQLVLAANKDVHFVVCTDGPNGAVASDRWHIVTAGMYEDVPVIDRSGAGDAFASGFIAKIACEESLESAVVFASANSTSVVGSIGAKKGILNNDSEIHGMPLEVKEIG